jgi:hypothetical protein
VAYYENSGQVNDEAISIAGGRTFQVIQLADSEGNIINPAAGDIALNGDVVIGTEIEISNDIGNPIPTIAGLGIPPHDDFELNNADTPTTITYRLGGTVVATVTLRYNPGGGLIGGSIAYPGA